MGDEFDSGTAICDPGGWNRLYLSPLATHSGYCDLAEFGRHLIVFKGFISMPLYCRRMDHEGF